MKKIPKILSQYNIPPNSSAHLLRESSDNQVYVVGNRQKKILRLSKKLPIEDAVFEHDVYEHLSHYNFPVAKWNKTRDGKLYASVDKTGIAVLFDFLEGYHVVVDKNHFPTKEQVSAAGKMLGSISKAGEKFVLSSPRSRTIFSELERAMVFQEIFEKDFEGGKIFIQQVKEVTNLGHKHKSINGLIHNDYRPSNIFFKNDSKISGVIDFDWSCIGPKIKDLALGALEWSFPDGCEKPNIAILDTFLDGYNSVSKIKYERNKELYFWIMFAALSDVATYFCDRIEFLDVKKNISSSYMYKKYLFFCKL